MITISQIKLIFNYQIGRVKANDALVTGLLYLVVVLFSVVSAYLFVKNDFLFTAIVMLVLLLFSINWPFFSIMLLVSLSIVQPGLFNETLNTFRPFFLISGASLISWFLGFTSRRFKNVVQQPQVIFLLGLVIAETFGTLRMSYLTYTLETLMLWIRIFFIFFLVSSLVNSTKKIKFILWITVISSVFIACYALNIYFITPEKMVDGRLAAYGMYDNPNDLALLMVVTWPLIYKLMEIERSKAAFFLLGLFLLIITVTLVLTVSRGGILGLLAVGMLSLWSSQKVKRVYKIIILVGGLGLALVAVPILLSQRGEESGFDAGDESASHRVDAWRAAGRIFLAYPAGVGFDQYLEHGDSFGGPSNLYPHNTPVKVAAEGGFLGLFCYLSLFFLTLKRLIVIEQRFLKHNLFTMACFSQAVRIGFIGFLINTSFSQKEFEWILYIVLGLSVAIIDMSEKTLKNSVRSQPGISVENGHPSYVLKSSLRFN